ncbi:riboflavin synthase [Candidatus Sumerlaeota bacterium]|nr:riboflavin synthase [Candidatus Sumerlaeota bacterium]
MFTGLIQAVGTIERIETTGPNRRLWIATPAQGFDSLADGESVAVDGACLTVERIVGGRIAMFVSAETLARTTLGSRRAGDPVNLERSLALGERLGGHIVLGHVDGVGRLLGAQPRGEDFWVQVEATDQRWLPYLVEKGSIAVDGISLTIAAIEGNRIGVAIVPYTWRHTTIGKRRAGDLVNLEFDLIGKYVVRWLEMRGQAPSSAGNVSPEAASGDLTIEFLRQAGFA